jgi:hypothetical protein
MTQRRVESIVVEPFTAIVSFDAISHRTYIALSGAIGHYVYPKKEEYDANKTKFFASPVGRRNKQKISELVSEIYAYLNANISEHADPRDYYFRLWVRLEVDRRTGEILSHPHFDIDVFRYLGKIGGKYSDVGKYSMKVAFVGKERFPVSSVFIKGVSKAKQQTGVIDFKIYETYYRAPDEIREKISKDSAYLIIDEEVHKIKPKIDSDTGEVFSFIKENSHVTEFKSEEDVLLYIVKKVKIRPQIIGSETGLNPQVDKEIQTISPRLTEKVVDSEVDFVSSLGVEQILERLSKKLEGLDTLELPKELEKQYKSHLASMETLTKDFTSLKVRLEVQEDELGDLEKDRDEKKMDEDQFRSFRVKTITALKTIRTEMVKFQKELKQETAGKIDKFVRVARKEGKEKSVKK